MLNLILLAAATTLVRQSGGTQQYVVFISTSAALLDFAITLVYHAILRVKNCIKKHKAVNEGPARVDTQSAVSAVCVTQSEDADNQALDENERPC